MIIAQHVIVICMSLVSIILSILVTISSGVGITRERFRDMNSVIIIMQPSFGFANRLRCMASAVILAKKLNAELKLDWKPNNDIAANWEDIIQSPQWPKPSASELSKS